MKTFHRLTLTAALLFSAYAAADAKEISPSAAPQKYTYIVVLKDRIPGDGAGSHGEPDIPGLGGDIVHQWRNRRVVRMSAAAVRALSAHRGVKYIQRVQVEGQVPPLPRSESPTTSITSEMVEADWIPPTWSSGDYVYDGDGNITSIGTTASPASDGGKETYVYDSVNRLVQATITHGTSHWEKYTYDSFGNLVYTERTAGPDTATPTSLQTNRLTGVAAEEFVYDSVGNVEYLNGFTTKYVYDGVNMMRAKETSSGPAWYIYTADDERIGVEENGEQRWMIRDLSGKVLREWESGASGWWLWREDHIYRNGSLAAGEREPAEGGTRHFHLDHLGTPRLITDSNRAKIALHDYFPYGVEMTNFRQEMEERGTEWPEPMKFTGHERDFTGGISTDNRNQLDYMHARYYNPVWGRFLSADPLRDSARPNQPQTWNRYAYVRNNPIGRVDRNGLIDVRSDQDKQVTEASATLVTSSQLIDSTSQGVEYGAILGANGKVSSGIFTSNDPGFVDPRQGVDLTGSSPRVKGTNELPTHSMHTHLAAGKYKVPGTTMTFEATKPGEPSSGDKQMAKATVPGFIVVPALRQVIKVERDGSFKVVLSEKDYDAWAKRAAAAVTDKEKEKK